MSTVAKDSPTLEDAIDLRFGQVGLASIRLRSIQQDEVRAAVERRVSAAPGLLDRAAVVVDFSHLPELPDPKLAALLLTAIGDAGMKPVGLSYGSNVVEDLARQLDLPLIAKFRQNYENNKTTAGAPAPESAPSADAPTTMASQTLHHTQPVRSGQQVYAAGGDLAVVAPVANGAEVLADGSIHVYGRLSGRALAGALGDEDARVYCTDFRAELVSIAGHYRVFEQIPAELEGRAVHCRLDGDRLLIEALNSAGPQETKR